MKKLFICLTLLMVFFSVADAADETDSQNNLTEIQNLSPYGAIFLGRQTFSLDEKTQWAGDINGSTHYPFGTDDFSSALAFGLKQTLFEKWSLGLEAFVSGNSLQYKQTSSSSLPEDNYYVEQNLRNTWGIQFLPGYYLSPGLLVYVPVGWVHSQFNLSSDAPENITTLNKQLNGLRLGFGLEQAINDSLHLRLEYDHNDYQNFSSHFNNGSQQKTRDYNLSTNQFNLGLAYYLDAVNKQHDQTMMSLKDGWYLGAGLGQSVQTSQLTLTETQENLYQSQTLYSSDIMGSLFAGYGTTFKSQIYLGGEVGGILESNNHSQSASLNNIAISRDGTMHNTLEVSVLPGYQVAPNFRLYGRLGYAQGYYSYATEQDDISTHKNKTLEGFVTGIGAELAIAEHWALRGEYQEINYSSLSEQVDTFSEKVKPAMHYYTLGAIYHFG